jgi:hypothetical protein
MDRPVKKDDRTPHRGGQAQFGDLHHVGSSRKKLESAGQESSPGRQPPGTSPLSRARILSSPKSSSNLEFTKKTMIEAQAYRTSVRVGELEREATRNDAVSNGIREGEQQSVEADLFARVSPSYPNTAARRNITVRKSRDRLDGAASSKSPEEITNRRSSR